MNCEIGSKNGNWPLRHSPRPAQEQIDDQAEPHANASTISFNVAQPPTFSAAALATAIEAPTPNFPLEDGAATLAGAGTVALACETLPGFLPGFPGIFFLGSS